MPWWRKPFTVTLVPHDGSDSVSLTFSGFSLFLTTLVLSILVGLGTFFSLAGFNHTRSDSSEHLRQRITKLQQQNRRYEKLNSSVQTLQKKLRKNANLQQSILKINGFDIRKDPSSTRKSVSITNAENTSMKIDNAQANIKNLIERNKQLKSIRRFVKNRNKVFQHTPVLWPVEGWLSSNYGYRQDPMGGQGRDFHQGVDIAAWRQSPVRAPADGTVIESKYEGGYGNTIKVRHEYGYTTVYGHLNERAVEKGDSVQKGQLIGRVGSTGHSTGSHLHYEIRINGEATNPWPYLVQNYESYQTVKNQEAGTNAGN
jgi:murein DD-endopeptidase MepM/ murein hydrolase activator NlpD